MEDIDCVTGKERKMGPRDKHTMTQIMEREKKKEKKNKCICSWRGVDGQCFPLVVLIAGWICFAACVCLRQFSFIGSWG